MNLSIAQINSVHGVFALSSKGLPHWLCVSCASAKISLIFYCLCGILDSEACDGSVWRLCSLFIILSKVSRNLFSSS